MTELGTTTKSPPRLRRVRRPTHEVCGLILDAARFVFAERGFAGATTRQIAEKAGVAEPLIFSNFGTKATLFAEAVIAPFNARFEEFLKASDTMPPDRAERSARFVHNVYPFFRDNADLLYAMVKSSGDAEVSPLHGLDEYFSLAVAQMRSQYATRGLVFDLPPELVVRYSFAMLAGAVLLDRWLFPESGTPSEEAERALARMIFKAAEPAGR